ncbi:hypothetical protein BJ170DRAFT_666875 [Xylariales sp. AK1849]|nr:hypothetical protein BJ170DRAFT_666875 [Xylariales sp. AK1849]
MATLELEGQWHPGEEEMHHMLHVPNRDNPTYPGLPPSWGLRITKSPLVAFGTLDLQGRPWTTVWGGIAGFCSPVAHNVLGVNATADMQFDPVVQQLFARKTNDSGMHGEIIDDELVRPEGRHVLSALSIDLETQDRVKIAGLFVAGAARTSEVGVGNVQMAFHVEESLGNCPKYLNLKKISPHRALPHLSLSRQGTVAGLPLSKEAVALIGKSDLFFISSKHGHEKQTMDTNHRGGPRGFVRIFRNDLPANGGVSLIYPEYSGNRLYQTLGNLRTDPLAGLVFPDFDTGDVLYLTGRATVLIGDSAAVYLPHTKLAVKIDVDEAKFVEEGLSFRGTAVGYSSYNPPLRYLYSEQASPLPAAGPSALATATLLAREQITPTISRFVFKFSPGRDKKGRKMPLRIWQPGQHVTLDFSSELYNGWEHMRDDDPQSLNDDFVRTFTVSAPPGANVTGPDGKVDQNVSETEFEITVRKHGPATGLLWRWNLRVPLELPVLGFGGSEGFRLQIEDGKDGKQSVFIAGGVGITPLMAQAKAILDVAGDSALRVLWSLRGEDLPLAVKTLKEVKGLGKVTKLFVTGEMAAGEKMLLPAELGTQVVIRRMDANDVTGVGEQGKRKFYCCAGPRMMKDILKWTASEDVVFESFGY